MNTRSAAFDSDLIAENGEEIVLSTSRFSVDSVMQSVRNFATLSEALRILGAGVILASMSVFMLQGWSEGNDISRYLMLLAQTGLLAAAGFAMSHVVQETRGARLFFGLALVSIPANFTILGALLYSVFQWDGGLTTYPGYAEWRIEDVASIGVTMSAAMLVLVPVTLFCFAIMARRSTKPLSLHFLMLNALLLLPIRHSLAAGTIALIGVLYALFVMSKVTRSNPALKTGEGKFALATLFIPLGIILFRSMYFYQVDSLMIAMVGLVLFLAARQVSQFPDRSARLATALELVSWPLAMTIAFALTDAFEANLANGLEAALFAGIYAGLALDIIRRTDSRELARAIGVSISIATAISFTFSVALNPSAMSALFSLGAGLLLLLWGAAGKRLVTIIAGLITAGAGAIFGFDQIVHLIVSSSWVDLAIFGASAIVLGSVLDRHGVAIKLRLTNWYLSAGNDKQAHSEDLATHQG
ncbi:MAG: hypothetical protein KJO82_13030 [Gammaproteobacteria bacterium]|nr:hypothetical protein [Gammaproteobacteria bacterium]